MRRVLTAVLGLLLLAVVALQFVPVDRSNPPDHADLSAPAEVRAVLERSCFDCHSNRTRWPWYSRIAPVSWLVAKDVREGREHLNLSTWDRLPASKQTELLEEMVEEVAEGKMPLGIYLRMHRDAAVSAEDLALLRSWGAGASGAAGPGSDGYEPEEHESEERAH